MDLGSHDSARMPYPHHLTVRVAERLTRGTDGLLGILGSGAGRFLWHPLYCLGVRQSSVKVSYKQENQNGHQPYIHIYIYMLLGACGPPSEDRPRCGHTTNPSPGSRSPLSRSFPGTGNLSLAVFVRRATTEKSATYMSPVPIWKFPRNLGP